MEVHIKHDDRKTIVYGAYCLTETDDDVRIMWPDDITSDNHIIPDATISSTIDLHNKSENAIAVDINSDAQDTTIDVLVATTNTLPVLQRVVEHHIEDITGFADRIELIE